MNKDINDFNKIRRSLKKGVVCLSQQSLGDCLNIFYEKITMPYDSIQPKFIVKKIGISLKAC